MQVQSRVGLRPHDLIDPLGRECLDRPVGECRRSVDHCAQGVHGRYAVEHALQLLPVGRVAGDDLQLGAVRPQLCEKLIAAFRLRTLPADQQQVPNAVAAYEMPGDPAAQRAGAAGDENSAVRAEHRVTRVGSLRARQPGNQHPAPPQRDLRFTARHGGRQHLRGVRRVVDIREDEAAGVLALSGADQSPDGRVVGPDLLIRGRLHGAARDEDELRIIEPRLGEPSLHQFQREPGFGSGVGRRGSAMTSAEPRAYECRKGVGQLAQVRRLPDLGVRNLLHAAPPPRG